MHGEDYSGERKRGVVGIFSLNLAARLWQAPLDSGSTCNGKAVTRALARAARRVAHPGEHFPQLRVPEQGCRPRRHAPAWALWCPPAPGLHAEAVCPLHFSPTIGWSALSAFFGLPVYLHPPKGACAQPYFRLALACVLPVTRFCFVSSLSAVRASGVWATTLGLACVGGRSLVAVGVLAPVGLLGPVVLVVRVFGHAACALA